MPQMMNGHSGLVEYTSAVRSISKGVFLSSLEGFVAPIVMSRRATRNECAPGVPHAHLRSRCSFVDQGACGACRHVNFFSTRTLSMHAPCVKAHFVKSDVQDQI